MAFSHSGFGQAQDPALKEVAPWEKSAALGLTLTRGNSKTLLFTGNIQATKQDSYDNDPAPGRQKNDLKFVTAIAYKF